MASLRLETLLEGYIEQGLTPAQRAELQDLLQASRENALVFWQQLQQHALLSEHFAEVRGYQWAKRESEACDRVAVKIGSSIGAESPWHALKFTPRPRHHFARTVIRNISAVAAMAAAIALIAMLPLGTWKSSAPSRPLAYLAEVQGDVMVRSQTSLRPGRVGLALHDGQELRTGGEGSFAVLRYTDGTRLDLNPDTTVRLIGWHGEGDTGSAGKKIFLVAGVLGADVAKQPVDRPMILSTPHARVRVLGTRFISSAASDATRIELEEGRVQVTRKSDGRTIDVRPGSYAIAASGKDLFAPLPLPARLSKPLAVLPVGGGQVLCVAYSPDGHTIATASADGRIGLWEASTGALRTYLIGPHQRVVALAFAPNGRTLAAAGHDRLSKTSSVLIWNLESEQITTAISVFRDVRALAFTLDDRMFVVAGAGGKRGSDLRLFDLEQGIEIPISAWNLGGIQALAMARDGNVLAAVGRDKTVRLWDFAARSEARVLATTKEPLIALALSPDGLTLAGGGKDKRIHLWNVKDGSEITALNNLTGRVSSLAFSPDGLVLASGAGGRATLWDLETSQEMLSLRGHKGAVTSVAFSPDGQTLATAASDQTARLWDLGGQRKMLNRR